MLYSGKERWTAPARLSELEDKVIDLGEYGIEVKLKQEYRSKEELRAMIVEAILKEEEQICKESEARALVDNLMSTIQYRQFNIDNSI